MPMNQNPMLGNAQAYSGATQGPYGLQMPQSTAPQGSGFAAAMTNRVAAGRVDASSGNYFGIDPNAKDFAGQSYAALTRDMWNTYVTQFMPFENKLIEYATDPEVVDRAMEQASQGVAGAFTAQRQATDRRIRGLGLQLDGDEQAAIERSSGLAQSLADVSAQNTARDMTRARQQAIIGNPAPGIPQM